MKGLNMVLNDIDTFVRIVRVFFFQEIYACAMAVSKINVYCALRLTKLGYRLYNLRLHNKYEQQKLKAARFFF